MCVSRQHTSGSSEAFSFRFFINSLPVTAAARPQLSVNEGQSRRRQVEASARPAALPARQTKDPNGPLSPAFLSDDTLNRIIQMKAGKVVVDVADAGGDDHGDVHASAVMAAD